MPVLCSLRLIRLYFINLVMFGEELLSTCTLPQAPITFYVQIFSSTLCFSYINDYQYSLLANGRELNHESVSRYSNRVKELELFNVLRKFRL